LIVLSACDGGGGGSAVSLNKCFSIASSDPCFDGDAVGETNSIDDKSTDDVIEEEENEPGFIRQLNVKQVLRTFGYSIFLPPLDPECRWDESVIVVNTEEDWDRFQESCFYEDNLYHQPDVDFTKFMLLVSYQDQSGFGTQIVAVLEFDSELVVVVEDRISDVPAQSLGFPSYIGRVKKTDKISNVIRVQSICNSFFNLSDSECLAESLTNSCQFATCSFRNGNAGILKPNCTPLDCSTVQCERISVIDNNMSIEISGTITDLGIDETGTPTGIINIDGEDREVGCGLVVE
jgi:hypothetical protein